MIGFDVMLNMLPGENSGNDVLINVMGKIITALELKSNDDYGDALHFEFSDGSKIKLRDDGQSCCERRYMQTDDNLEDYIGAKLLGVEIKEAPDIIDDIGEKHEVQFLEIKTDRGVLTMANHNEHNGWYGGFWIVAEAA